MKIVYVHATGRTRSLLGIWYSMMVCLVDEATKACARHLFSPRVTTRLVCPSSLYDYAPESAQVKSASDVALQSADEKARKKYGLAKASRRLYCLSKTAFRPVYDDTCRRS